MMVEWRNGGSLRRPKPFVLFVLTYGIRTRENNLIVQMVRLQLAGDSRWRSTADLTLLLSSQPSSAMLEVLREEGSGPLELILDGLEEHDVQEINLCSTSKTIEVFSMRAGDTSPSYCCTTKGTTANGVDGMQAFEAKARIYRRRRQIRFIDRCSKSDCNYLSMYMRRLTSRPMHRPYTCVSLASSHLGCASCTNFA